MGTDYRVLAGCCLAMIAALLVVGAVSHGVIRHIVQTSPLWIVIALSVRKSAFAKWAALPCFVFWLLLMSAIWLFLLGWARIVSGTFLPTEIAMTLVVGLGSIIGGVTAVRMRTPVRAWPAVGTTMLLAILQIGALRLSLLPQIAHR